MNYTARILIFLLFVFHCTSVVVKANQPIFQWGNVSYFGLNRGETIRFNDQDVELLETKLHFNLVRVGNDTLNLQVSNRSLPRVVKGIRIFVADNKFMKSFVSNPEVHGLTQKDVVLCLSQYQQKMLDPRNFIFPVSFNDGYIWSAEEDSHIFSHQITQQGRIEVLGGIALNVSDAKGQEKHWILTIEDSEVVWVSEKNQYPVPKTRSVLLRSASNSNIYYLYERLYERNLVVKKGEKLKRGEAIGTVWGDENWGSTFISVIYSETIPAFENRYTNCVNFFPQLYELYYGTGSGLPKTYTKGIIHFALPKQLCGNRKNLLVYERYNGKGWGSMDWNYLGRVPAVAKGEDGNVRLKKTLFGAKKAHIVNPRDYYDYEIGVHNGVYRIRTKVGDLEKASWQRIVFEGVKVGAYSVEAGESKWTSEKIVQVQDGKLTVRIFVDPEDKLPAGISEIVFQRAY